MWTLIIIIIIVVVVVVVVDDDAYYWVYLSSDHLFQVYYKVRQFYYKCDRYYKVRQYTAPFYFASENFAGKFWT